MAWKKKQSLRISKSTKTQLALSGNITFPPTLRFRNVPMAPLNVRVIVRLPFNRPEDSRVDPPKVSARPGYYTAPLKTIFRSSGTRKRRRSYGRSLLARVPQTMAVQTGQVSPHTSKCRYLTFFIVHRHATRRTCGDCRASKLHSVLPTMTHPLHRLAQII